MNIEMENTGKLKNIWRTITKSKNNSFINITIENHYHGTISHLTINDEGTK